MERVYLDHNATTPMGAEVRARFHELLDEDLGNASSLHASGRRGRALLDQARERAAAALGVHEEELVFTSGGTEANNLALFGALAGREPGQPGSGLVTTAVEHSSILGPAERLAQEGRALRLVGVDSAGRPAARELVEAAQEASTGLVSVMTANNEVGSLGPLEALGSALQALPPTRRPLLHTDAAQALGRIPVDWPARGVDLASASFHKLGGPLGAGLLYRRRGVRLAGRVLGGGQEDELRAGTENVPAIAAGALALELAIAHQEEYAKHTAELTRLLFQEVERSLPDVRTLGPALDDPERLPNTLAISFPNLDGRVLVTRLDLFGLEVSAGSACASGALEPSHVLVAMGLPAEQARAGLRLSVGRSTTVDEIHRAVDILRKALQAV